MSKNESQDTNNQQERATEALLLASVAYCKDVKGNLSTYAPGWSLAWLPDKEVNGNFAYIAYNSGTNQYAVAIRGSVLNFSLEAFQDWFEQDFNVIVQHNWTYPDNSQNPRISSGAYYGLSDLISLVVTDNGQSVRMLEFLMDNAVANNASIMVCGHSLGGALASVLASWLHYQITSAGKPAPDSFPVFTFAAPSIGNSAFVTAYDNTFPDSWRYYNALDIVPMAAASVVEMGSLYPAPAPEASSISATYKGNTVTLQEVFKATALLLDAAQLYYNSYYTPTNLQQGSVELNQDGNLCKMTSNDPLIQWFEQAGGQHAHNTYLDYLGYSDDFSCSESL